MGLYGQNRETDDAPVVVTDARAVVSALASVSAARRRAAFRAMGARGDRRGDARGRSRRDRRRGRPVATRDADTSEEEWTEEDGDVSRDVEAGGALARDGSRDASSSAAPSRDARHERASRHASWSVPIRTASERSRGELEPILKKTSSRFFPKRPRSSRSFADDEHDEHDEYELDAFDASSSFGRRHKTRARVVLGATLVLGLACATGVTVVSAAAHRERIAERVATFPRRFSSERAGGPALRHVERRGSSFAHDAENSVSRLSGFTNVRSSDATEVKTEAEPKTTSFGSEASFSDFGGAASPPTAARAGLFLPARPSSKLGRDEPGSHRETVDDKRESERRASALSRLRDVPLLGRFLGVFDEKEEDDARDDVVVDETSARVFSSSPSGATLVTTRLSNAAQYARDGLEDLFFPALGDARTRRDFAETSDFAATSAATNTDDVSDDALHDSVPKTEKKYLIGLTTSAGFGDQFKRMSTYAAMARELNRTLVVWPVFTSPHYDLDGRGPRKEGAKPLFFDEYVRIGGDGVTDDADRLVSYRDPSLPARVREFPMKYPEACLTSNGEKVDVQFLTSADLSQAVVAKADTATSYEEQVRLLRRLGDGSNALLSSTSSPETLCVASTFGDADYNKARHGETALAWKSLDFKPVGRFHHWWANAVDNMVLKVRAAKETGEENIDDGFVDDLNGTRKRRATALRLFDAKLDGEDAGAGAVADRAVAMERGVSDETRPGQSVDRREREPNPGHKSFQRTEPSFRVTEKYTALHWRRGDKCGHKSKRQASRGVGPNGHAFDEKKTGASQALLCDEASYLNAPVLDLCLPLAPMYVATDDQDEKFLAHVKSKGCLLRDDVVVSPPSVASSGETTSVTKGNANAKTVASLEDVDALVLDVMLVAGAEVSFTYGHTALARLYDRMRMSRGAPRSINVAADAEAFRRAYAAAQAGSGAAAAAAATLGEREGELVANDG
jgi:hypothetical protein